MGNSKTADIGSFCLWHDNDCVWHIVYPGATLDDKIDFYRSNYAVQEPNGLLQIELNSMI